MFRDVGYTNTEFTLDLGDKFDTSSVTTMWMTFYGCGYNSTKLNTSITIKNPNTTVYSNMFNKVATKEGSKIKVYVVPINEELMIARKTMEMVK